MENSNNNNNNNQIHLVKKKREKTGGRQKGTVNKTTGIRREFINLFCEQKYDDFIKAFENMQDPYQKCKIWLEAQTFITPKMSQLEVSTYEEQEKDLQSELDEIAEININNGKTNNIKNIDCSNKENN